MLAIECVKDHIITGGTDCKVRIWWAVEERKALQHPWFELEVINSSVSPLRFGYVLDWFIWVLLQQGDVHYANSPPIICKRERDFS